MFTRPMHEEAQERKLMCKKRVQWALVGRHLLNRLREEKDGRRRLAQRKQGLQNVVELSTERPMLLQARRRKMFLVFQMRV